MERRYWNSSSETSDWSSTVYFDEEGYGTYYIYNCPNCLRTIIQDIDEDILHCPHCGYMLSQTKEERIAEKIERIIELLEEIKEEL